MRRLLYLAVISVVAVLVFALAAGAQEGRGGHGRSQGPPHMRGQAEPREQLREQREERQDLVRERREDRLDMLREQQEDLPRPMVQPQPMQAQPAVANQATAAPSASASATATPAAVSMLPDTGGFPIVAVAAGLLVGAGALGLLAFAVYRRSS